MVNKPNTPGIFPEPGAKNWIRKTTSGVKTKFTSLMEADDMLYPTREMITPQVTAEGNSISIKTNVIDSVDAWKVRYHLYEADGVTPVMGKSANATGKFYGLDNGKHYIVRTTATARSAKTQKDRMIESGDVEVEITYDSFTAEEVKLLWMKDFLRYPKQTELDWLFVLAGTMSSQRSLTLTDADLSVPSAFNGTAVESSSAPVFMSSMNNMSFASGEFVNLTLPSAVDPDGDVLSYSVSHSLLGLNFNPTTRVLSGALDGLVGVYPVTYTVTNTSGETCVSTFNISVAAATHATPDAFDIPVLINQSINTVVTTNAITVSGINVEVDASTTLGTIVKNGTNTWLQNVEVKAGDTVAVSLLTSSGYSAESYGVLTIGNVSDSFFVTTLPDPEKSQI